MSSVDINQITEKVNENSGFGTALLNEVSTVVIGQKAMLEKILIGMLSNGHILLEGLPGLAKTTMVQAFADAITLDFSRIQFTPDLLPADLLGTQIYNAKTGEFEVKKGPLFSNIILADEINRAPSKVQSALLESMQERQITIGDTTYKLDEPFVVLATQNPIEQEGTYPLPEAQVDRFMFKLHVDYPTQSEEREILDVVSGAGLKKAQPVVSAEQLLKCREVVREVYMDDRIKDYIVSIVAATRDPMAFGIKDLTEMIEVGASPRASINLAVASKAHAFLKGRAYVTPEDIKSIGMDVLRHRMILSYEAEAEEISSEMIVQKIFDSVEVP
ncbi:MAG: MoxR family ATPase [Fibrobacterales bacterium]